MKFINKNLPTISLILISLIGLSLTLNLKTTGTRSCLGGNNSLPECRWVNILGPKGLCVSSGQVNGNLQQSNCANTPEMLWNVVPYKNGYLIQNKSGRMMDNSGQGKNNGNKVLGYTNNSSAAQIWAIESVNNGNHVHFKNLGANKCFDNTGTVRVGQYYHIWDCSNSNQNQWFSFELPVGNGSNGYVNLVGPTGLCVSDRITNGNLTQQTCGGSNDLLWTFIPYAGGSMLRSMNGRMMDNSGQGSSNGNKVLGYGQNNSAAQIWRVSAVDNGAAIQIKNVQRNKCFDDTGIHKIGQYYHIWTCTSSNKNQWFVPKIYKAPVAPVQPIISKPVTPVNPVPVNPVSPDSDDNLERNKNSKRKMRKGRKN